YCSRYNYRRAVRRSIRTKTHYLDIYTGSRSIYVVAAPYGSGRDGRTGDHHRDHYFICVLCDSGVCHRTCPRQGWYDIRYVFWFCVWYSGYWLGYIGRTGRPYEHSTCFLTVCVPAFDRYHYGFSAQYRTQKKDDKCSEQ